MSVRSIRRWTVVFAALVLAPLVLAPTAADAAIRAYVYTVHHARYGVIGAYTRTVDDGGGEIRARSHLQIQVKILGITAHREIADQSETWQGGRLIAFQSDTQVNGKDLKVSGQAHGDHFMITTPTGVVTAPVDVCASDPWSFSRAGHASVVSLRSGKLDQVDVTGGEADRILLRGGAATARHFHVSTAAQPDKWEAWLDNDGMPLKFRSFDHGDAVDFTLASHTP